MIGRIQKYYGKCKENGSTINLLIRVKSRRKPVFKSPKLKLEIIFKRNLRKICYLRLKLSVFSFYRNINNKIVFCKADWYFFSGSTNKTKKKILVTPQVKLEIRNDFRNFV